MTQIIDTFQTGDAVGNREQLSDVVTTVSPMDTPFMSMIGRKSTRGVNPEWEKDDLSPPDLTGATRIEGYEYAFGAISPPDRIGNYTEILDESFTITESQQMAENAGNHEHMKRQKVKAGIRLRRKYELACLSNRASNKGSKTTFSGTGSARTGSGGVARVMGGLPTWYETNYFGGADDLEGGYQSDGQTDAVTKHSAQRAFTKDQVDNVIESVYNAGGMVNTVMLSPYAKRVFSGFMLATSGSTPAIVPFRQNIKARMDNTVIGTVDAYQSDFGVVSLVPNRVMAQADRNATNANDANVSRFVHFIDPQMLEFVWYRPMRQVKNLAKTHDADKFLIRGEGTLCVKNEASLGCVGDIFGLSSTR